MSATTVGNVRAVLSTYVEPDTEFIDALNLVLARMHTLGIYKDLTIQYTLPVIEGAITLPDEADSVLHALVSSEPRPVRDLWHDFIQSSVNQTDQSWGIVDSGFHPSYLDNLDPDDTGTLTKLYIVPSPSDWRTTAFDTTGNNSITVKATDGDQVYLGTVTLDAGDPIVQFSSGINRIISITYEFLPATFELRTDKNEVLTAFATLGPESGTTRYRRFRVLGSTDKTATVDGTAVSVLTKRKFKPLKYESDVVYLGSLNAIKHGLLGRVAEDNADLERAEYHWNTCRDMLDEDLTSARGAAIPSMKLDLYGGNDAVLPVL